MKVIAKFDQGSSHDVYRDGPGELLIRFYKTQSINAIFNINVTHNTFAIMFFDTF